MFRALGKNAEGKSTNWQLQNSPRDVKDSIGNMGNNVVVTTYDARWLLDISGESLCIVYDCLNTMVHT